MIILDKSRIGRFTASTISQLLSEPRTLDADTIEQYAHLVPARFRELKSGPRKGELIQVEGYSELLRNAMYERGILTLGESGTTLAKDKASERVTGLQIETQGSFASKRGTVLEEAAKYLISLRWKQVDNTTFTGYGDNAGATADGVIMSETVDIKCPVSHTSVLRFGSEVPDMDFDALELWDKKYAWQIMMQAKCHGASHAWLIYFTDMLPWIPITHEEREEAQQLIELACMQYNHEHLYPFEYSFGSDGFAFIARRFELTPERSAKIDAALMAGEKECLKWVEQYQKLKPTLNIK